MTDSIKTINTLRKVAEIRLVKCQQLLQTIAKKIQDKEQNIAHLTIEMQAVDDETSQWNIELNAVNSMLSVAFRAIANQQMTVNRNKKLKAAQRQHALKIELSKLQETFAQYKTILIKQSALRDHFAAKIRKEKSRFQQLQEADGG